MCLAAFTLSRLESLGFQGLWGKVLKGFRVPINPIIWGNLSSNYPFFLLNLEVNFPYFTLIYQFCMDIYIRGEWGG